MHSVHSRNAVPMVCVSAVHEQFIKRGENSDFAEFNVRLIHRKQVPPLHNTVLILCNEGAGLVAVILLDKIINGGKCILIYKHCG